jgi:hypothetical protein
MTWHPYDPCPCGCGVIGWKLTKPLWTFENGVERREPPHVVGCNCVRHRNIRNGKRGKRGQAKSHAALIGEGFTPYHEESGRFADITVRPEVKTGYPAKTKKLREFLASEWFKAALKQSADAIPDGIAARPAVHIDGRWLIVDTEGK